MTTPKNYVPVRGSVRTALSGAHAIGPADPNERVEVTVRIRSRSTTPLATVLATDQGRLAERRQMSHKEFRRTHGAAPEDLAKVAAFAREHGLEVVESNPARRSMVLAGTVSALSAAFGVELNKFEIADSGRTFRGRQGRSTSPASWNLLWRVFLAWTTVPRPGLIFGFWPSLKSSPLKRVLGARPSPMPMVPSPRFKSLNSTISRPDSMGKANASLSSN